MEIIKVNIQDIKTYQRNAKKHPKAQIEQIKQSIQEFGNNDPIAIDEDNVIIEGHGRYEALKQLGYTEVECIRLSHLDDEQKRAYILVHNKLTMNSDFDLSILEAELESIGNIDMSDYGFEFDFEDDEDIDLSTENHRETTYKQYNLQYNDLSRTEGFYQMPILDGVDFIPSDLIGFNYMLNSKNKDCGIHCFVDDYQINRLWTSPEQYIDRISEYECILTPDFSLYSDMPMSMKIWNTYRNRLVGQILQDAGLTVIPTVSWAEKETFEFCFDGLPHNSVVAVSTIGVKREDENFALWRDGMDEMIKRLTPSTILVYGGAVDYDFGGVDVVYYSNHVTERMREC